MKRLDVYTSTIIRQLRCGIQRLLCYSEISPQEELFEVILNDKTENSN